MSKLDMVAAELLNRTEILGNDRKVHNRQASMTASIFKERQEVLWSWAYNSTSGKIVYCHTSF